MRMDSVGRVEFLLKEIHIQKLERSEKELRDFIERLAMEVLMMRLEEGLVSGDEEQSDPEPRPDWAWDPPEELY